MTRKQKVSIAERVSMSPDLRDLVACLNLELLPKPPILHAIG